ncbi:neuronal acetylcholine receptor subunit alpha-10-like [Glandiceps talaboti]
MGVAPFRTALLLAGVFLQQIRPIHSSTAGVMLVESLLDAYPKYPVRPVKNETTPVVVNHRMTPIQLIDMDEKNQVITLKSWLGQEWRDEYLQWDPFIFDGIRTIQIPISEVWQPDTVLYGSVKVNFQRHFDTDAIIYSDGKVQALQPMVLKCTCTIDATLFPFDEQRCDFKFASWSYHSGLINYTQSVHSNIERFTENGEWKVLEMPIETNSEEYVCCPGQTFTDVTYTIHLQRRSMFYVVNIILPSFLACILISVGFFLPSDSGERVSLCVISILSQFVFLTVISDYMPPTAEVVPYIQRYFFITIGLAVMSAFVTACTLNMHFKGPVCPEAPKCLKALAFRYLASFACTRVRIRKYRIRIHRQRVENSRSEEVPLGPYRNGTQIMRQLSNDYNDGQKGACTNDMEGRQGEFYDKDPETQERRLREWREISRIFDRSYFVVYTLLQVILIGSYLTFIAMKGKYSHEEEDHDTHMSAQH